VTGFPPAPVRVTTFDVERDGVPGVDDILGTGQIVNVCPLVVTVVGLVNEEPGGKVKVTGFPPLPVIVKVLLPIVYVVPPITISVTGAVVGGVVVPVCEVLADIKDVIVACVVRLIVVGSSSGLNGGQFAGMLMTFPGKMRLGSAICGFPSSRQVRSTLYVIAKLYNVSPSTTMCCPPGDNGRLITSPGYIKSKSGICGFSASRRPSGMLCA